MKYLSVKEFRDLGLLQEINRRFLHPMGLALSVIMKEDGSISGFGKISDYRDDADGMRYDEEFLKSNDCIEKFLSVENLFAAKKEFRENNLGYHVQPITIEK